MNRQHKIIATHPLPNGFFQVTLESDQIMLAQPGQYVVVNNQYALYLMGHDQQKYDLMIPSFLNHLIKDAWHVSHLQGKILEPPKANIFYLLLFEDDALSAAIFYFKKYRKLFKGFAVLGSQTLFPFHPCPSRQMVTGVPPEVIGAIPLLEDWHIPHRLASQTEIPGCYLGTAQELAKIWLSHHHAIDLITLSYPALLSCNYA